MAVEPPANNPRPSPRIDAVEPEEDIILLTDVINGAEDEEETFPVEEVIDPGDMLDQEEAFIDLSDVADWNGPVAAYPPSFSSESKYPPDPGPDPSPDHGPDHGPDHEPDHGPDHELHLKPEHKPTYDVETETDSGSPRQEEIQVEPIDVLGIDLDMESEFLAAESAEMAESANQDFMETADAFPAPEDETQTRPNQDPDPDQNSNRDSNLAPAVAALGHFARDRKAGLNDSHEAPSRLQGEAAPIHSEQSVHPDQLDAAVTRVLTEMIGPKIDAVLETVITRLVSEELEQIKNVLRQRYSSESH